MNTELFIFTIFMTPVSIKFPYILKTLFFIVQISLLIITFEKIITRIPFQNVLFKKIAYSES